MWRPGVYVSDPEGSGQHILTADDIRGVPVPEAFDALVRIYETLAERALAEGGDDPFLEAARAALGAGLPSVAGRACRGRSNPRPVAWLPTRPRVTPR